MSSDVSSDGYSDDEFDRDYESNVDESSCLDHFTADENDDDDDDDYSSAYDEDDESDDKDIDDKDIDDKIIADVKPKYLERRKGKLKSLREQVKNWDSEKERLRLVRRLGRTVDNWFKIMPSLRGVFKREDEVERLLFDAVKSLIADDEGSRNYIAGVRFVEYAASARYRFRSFSRQRATPIHRLIGFGDRLAYRAVVGQLFKIYSEDKVNYVDESDGLTHLHVACELGLETQVQNYLKCRPQDVDCVWRKTGDTPLHLALARDHKQVIEMLLERNADLTLANNAGQTALHLFSQKLHDDELTRLYQNVVEDNDRPIPVNAKDKLGNAPLHLTLTHGHRYLSRMLLKRGADPELANAEGQTALHVICKRQPNRDDDDGLADMLFRICAELGKPLRVDAQDHRGNGPLHLALEHGNERLVPLLLDRGANPNLANEAGETPLHLIGRGSANFVNLFFELSKWKHWVVEENPRDERGNTPFHLALCYGKRKAAVLLLRRGSSPYLANGEGLTPLHLICANGYDVDDLLKVFLRICDELATKTNQPMCIDPRDREGNTPLHLALKYNGDVWDAKKLIQLLLDRGADPSAANNDGSTPLHFICRTYRHNDLLEIFLVMVDEKNRLLDIDARDEWGDTPLNLALRCGNTTEAKLLLSRGADPTVVDSRGSTPLHSICGSDYDRSDVVELMFEVCQRTYNRTLEVNTRDGEGKVALNLALERGNASIAELLLRKGADPSLGPTTALHAICRERRYLDLLGALDRSIVRLVRADPRDESGNAPLHLAVLDANDVAAEWLLRNGADPNLVNRAGDAPLHVICRQEQCHAGGLARMFFRVCRQVGRDVLLDVGDERGDAPLHLALRHENEEVAELLLKRGADSSRPDSEGSYPLHSICKRIHGEGLRKLLLYIDRAVPVDVRDKDGNTPLHLAVFHEKTTMVELLLRQGADPSIVDAEGRTALHIASTREHCDDELAKTLLEIGRELGREVPIDALDSRGKTALHLAVERKRRPLLRLLLMQGADPNAAKADGSRPLHMLSRCDDPDLAETLFECSSSARRGGKRLDMDARDKKRGDTALHLALRRECKTMVLLLLDRGAALNLANEEGSTVLHLICRKYHCEDLLLEYLLVIGKPWQRPLPIDARDRTRQNTALHYALALDHRQAARILISRGADPNVANAEGWTALHDLCQRYHDDALLDDFLAIASANEARRGGGCWPWPAVNARDKLGRAPLHLVPDYGHADLIKWLLKRGADPSRIDDATGLTPVNVFCKRYDDECDSTHKYKSLEVDARDERTGDTRLHRALRQGNERVAELLLVYGADPNPANKEGSTPLHVIAERELSSELGSMFFQLSHERRVQARIDSRDSRGNTPLHLALRLGRHMMEDNVAQELLIYGADPNLANDEGRTALHAICQRDGDVADFANGFFQLCAETRRQVRIDAPDSGGMTALHLAVLNGDKSLTETLLRRGAEPSLADNEGQTALHIGCARDPDGDRVASFLGMCESLERTVGIIDARDAKGNTPLHLALRSGNDRLAQILVNRGANPNLANEAGETPLHVICRSYADDGTIDVFLQSCAAKDRPVLIDARDGRGRTPLQWAVANLLPGAVDLLLKRGADLSTFVFPTEDYFGRRFERGARYRPEMKLAMMAHALVVVERLKKRGHQLGLDNDLVDDLVVVKFFATHQLCQRPSPDGLVRAREDLYYLKRIEMKPKMSLLQVVVCRTPREAKTRLGLTTEDYYEFVRANKWALAREDLRADCALHLCELMAREFCWEGAIEAFLELTRYKLPVECCHMIVDDTLENERLCNICLAAALNAARNDAA
ncbi:serine/threonine-protein phosphatase 6 regulatory ankyrin repeat subunit C-like [Trichogramma pretiosum]|uniref:serine/threonine-protein phosphatase 6 regulatory ankyrin repeat subunit C-like n=1 Tax=Trichogramma pretiosum TaxID=7493 RepID=UPI0006C9BB40|nr:serine/threonine-protein phosphatase 6 regulatory ankyrin repeat subunit C-like [Trichogramma pretiosum]XP_014238154.1 serine/threonine-protein phosphatase 6 regulatory ankyrin repeat subunit C-like [Trichogramma pretiosum]